LFSSCALNEIEPPTIPDWPLTDRTVSSGAAGAAIEYRVVELPILLFSLVSAITNLESAHAST
jgi:hypothetical protein